MPHEPVASMRSIEQCKALHHHLFSCFHEVSLKNLFKTHIIYETNVDDIFHTHTHTHTSSLHKPKLPQNNTRDCSASVNDMKKCQQLRNTQHTIYCKLCRLIRFTFLTLKTFSKKCKFAHCARSGAIGPSRAGAANHHIFIYCFLGSGHAIFPASVISLMPV